jgi:hypothetical protein
MAKHRKLTHVRERQLLAALILSFFLTAWPWPSED